MRYLLTTLFCVVLLLAIVTVCAVPFSGLTPLERWREMRSGTIFYRGSARTKTIALTFDDGPDPRYTPRVLDVLKAEHVKATFFVCGRMLQAHPELVKRIVAEGHVIGNHTDTHPRLETERDADVRREIDGCEARIEALTGERTHLFRPPRGLWNSSAFQDVRTHGYDIILWSLAFDRSQIKDSSFLRRRVVRGAKAGDILLFHDGSASKLDERRFTVREIRGVIEGLKQRGFHFATVPELLHIRGVEPTHKPTTTA